MDEHILDGITPDDTIKAIRILVAEHGCDIHYNDEQALRTCAQYGFLELVK